MEDKKNIISNADTELSDEELNGVAGGSALDDGRCPKCGSENIWRQMLRRKIFVTTFRYTCNSCGHTWEEIE